jgi:glycosyltransferase involved in cell wall biosynthesis
MVATEAWSRGLPVITTDRAGAADLLRPGENGMLVRPGDAGSIVECVEWCAAHRGELLRMREGALSTAARWQWSDYRAAHAAILRETGMFGGAP